MMQVFLFVGFALLLAMFIAIWSECENQAARALMLGALVCGFSLIAKVALIQHKMLCPGTCSDWWMYSGPAGRMYLLYILGFASACGTTLIFMVEALSATRLTVEQMRVVYRLTK